MKKENYVNLTKKKNKIRDQTYTIFHSVMLLESRKRNKKHERFVESISKRTDRVTQLG